MFLTRELLSKRTVSFRMTVLFMAFFSCAIATAFLLVYAVLSHTLEVVMDESLRLEADEFEVLYNINGVDGLRDVLIAESVAEGIDNAFYVFLSPEMEVIISSDVTAFEDITHNGYIPIHNADSIRVGEERLLTLHNEAQSEYIRLFITKFEDGTLLEIGEKMRVGRLVLNKTRNIFLVSSLSILFIGTVVFWNIMRRTMKGVTQISTTVSNIGRNDLVSRVPMGNRGIEIDNLAEAFNRMLERIAVLIGEMQDITNNVAHYLRTPIARIRGTAETVYFNEDDSASSKDPIAAIIQECDRLTMMIQVMLEIASIESATSGNSEGPVDVNNILEDIVDLFQPAAENKAVALEYELSESELTIHGNPALLSGAVANLVDNAVKYTPPNGTVTIRSCGVGDTAEISVSDTGIGISTEDRPHIFEKFYRGGQVEKTIGNGLGLPYVQAVARRYKGMVRVDTTGVSGTTFTLVFPILKEHGDR